MEQGKLKETGKKVNEGKSPRIETSAQGGQAEIGHILRRKMRRDPSNGKK
jgi:hypothetical protein